MVLQVLLQHPVVQSKPLVSRRMGAAVRDLVAQPNLSLPVRLCVLCQEVPQDADEMLRIARLIRLGCAAR